MKKVLIVTVLSFMSLVAMFSLFSSCELNPPVAPRKVTAYDDGIRTIEVIVAADMGGRFEILSENEIIRKGDHITLKLIPDSGWFVSDVTGIEVDLSALKNQTDNPSELLIPLTIEEDLMIEITFEQSSCILILGELADCSVTIDGETSSSGEYHFYENERVSLSVTPDSGFFFSHWQSDSQVEWTTSEIHFVMSDNVSLTPVMARQLYTVSSSVTGNGTIAFSPMLNDQGRIAEYTELTITAQPEDGWAFSSWSDPFGEYGVSFTASVTGDLDLSAEFTQIMHEIDLTVIGEGTVNRSIADSSISQGSEIEFTAQPARGWSFLEWRGALTGHENPQTISVADEIVLTAVFERNEHALTVNSADGGSAAFTQNWQTVVSVFENESATLTAVADSGWSFSHWSGDLYGDTNPLTIIVNAPITVTPVFSRHMYDIAAYATGSGSVAATFEGDPVTSVAESSEVHFTAAAEPGWFFSHWEGDLAGSVTPQTLIVNADTQVTAVFVQQTFDLLLSAGDGGGVSCNTAPENIPFGAHVTIEATPVSGWSFLSWTGDLTGNSAIETLVMDGPKSITALFERNAHSLTIESSTGGTAAFTQNGQAVSSVFENETVTLSTSAEPGWSFSHWEGSVSGSMNPLTITVVEAMTAAPVFSRNICTISTYATGSGAVEATVGGGAVTSIAENTEVLFTATAEPGWYFSRWEGDLAGSVSPQTLMVNADIQVTAVFVQQTFDLILSAGEGGRVTCDSVLNDIPFGAHVTIDAVPDSGWSFVRWTGDLTGNSVTETVVMDGPKSITALFERNTHSLTIGSATGGTAAFSQNGQAVSSVFENETVTLSASAETGWSFSHWEGSVSGSMNPLIITVVEAMTATPVFSRNICSISTYTTGSGAVEATVGGGAVTSIAENTEVLFTATAEPGWNFSHWEGDLAGSAASQALRVNADTQVTAVFVQQTFDLLLSAGEGGHTVCNVVSTDIPYGTEVTIEAVPDNDWEFLRWEGDLVSTERIVQLIMDEPKNINAVFGKIHYSIQPVLTTPGSSVELISTGQTLNNQTFLKDSIVDLRALPPEGAEGYLFSHWLVDGIKSGVEPEIQIFMNQDHRIEPVFYRRNWLFLVYMNGDCDLETNAIQDLNEMETVDLNQEGVEILVLFDRTDGFDGSNGDWKDTRLLRVVFDENANDLVIRSYEVDAPPLGLEKGKQNELNMGDPLILSSFIDYAQTAYKADHYGLFIWGHGNGWRNARSLLQTAEGSDSLSPPYSSYSSSYRSFTADASNGSDPLFTAELGSAVTGHSRNIDTVLFDTCSGGMLEVAYELRESVSYMAASEDLIPADGMEYDLLFANIASRLNSGGVLTDGGLGSLAVDSFAQAYVGQSGANYAVSDLTRIGTINSRLNDFSTVVSAYCTTQERADQVRGLLFGQNGETTESFFQAGADMNLDLYDMARAVSAEGIAVTAAQNLMTAVSGGVIHSWTHAAGNPRASGLAVHYVPLNHLLNAEAHDPAYLQNSNVSFKPAFIADSTWVPNLNTQTGLLYTLWYRTY